MNDVDTVTLPSSYDLDVDGAIAMYVELRREKAALKAAMEEAQQPLTEAMDKIATLILKHMQDTNTKAATSDHGTAYQRTVRSATIKDKQAFRDYVVAEQLFDLLDWRANAPAVFDHMKNSEIEGEIPGLKTSSFLTIGVRKSNGSSEDE